MSTRSVTQFAQSFLVAVVLIGLGITSTPNALKADVLTPLGDIIFDADLEDPWHLAISPDNKHVYVTSQWRDGALIGLKRNTSTGQLEHMYYIKDDRKGTDGLGGPNGVIISKNGKFVYVASGGDSAVAVFTRNASTGALTFVEVEKGGVDPWNVFGCFGLALSPDQKHLYVTGHSNNTIAVFSANASTGELTFVAVLRNNEGGLSNFRGPRGVTVTPDGKHVFVAAESSHTLFIFDRNSTTGRLTLARAWEKGTDGLTGLASPWQIVFTSAGLNAYIACPGFGFVVLRRDSTTKPWSVLEEHGRTFPDNGLGGCRYLALSPDETRLYVSARDSSSLSVYARDPLTGRVGKLLQLRQWVGGLRHFVWPNQVIVSPDGGDAYVATSDDAVHCFALQDTAGEISWNPNLVIFGEPNQVQQLRDCEKICISPDGMNVYFPSAGDDTITCFRRNKTTGLLSHIQTIGTYDDWYPVDCLANVSQIIVSSNGRNVYACSRGQNAIVHLNRDATDGHLVFRAAYYNNGGVTDMVSPSGIALSPDNKDLYAVAAESDSIVSFDVQTDGSLIFKGSFVNGGTHGCDRLDGPSNLCFSPDGKYLYVTAVQDDAIIVFSRDSAGVLAYKGFVSNGLDSVHGLDDPLCIAIPPDGKHVYAAAWHESSIACFTRNSTTGALGFIDTCAAFWGCGINMTFDSTGQYLYMPSQGRNTVAALKRDTKTGLLTVVDQKSGVPPEGLDGLAGPRSVAISPDNKHLYVGCTYDDCLRIFKVSQ